MLRRNHKHTSSRQLISALLVFIVASSVYSQNSCETIQPTCRCDDQSWLDQYNNNIKTAEETTTDIDIVFYGDSITMRWFRWKDNREMFDKYFRKSISKNAHEGIGLGIGGDTTGNLLWRLNNGEMPTTLRSKVFFILIGTNDYHKGPCSSEDVFKGVVETLDDISEKVLPNDFIVVSSILPRGNFTDGQNSDVIGKIKKTNSLLHEYISSLEVKQIRYFDSWDDWFVTDGSCLNETLFISDLVHPSTEGYNLLGSLIVNYLEHDLHIQSKVTYESYS